MKTVAVLTEDFAAYHDLVRALRRADLPFESLTFGDPIPPRVGVVITTEPERHRVPFPRVVAMDDDAQLAVQSAKRQLEGKDRYASLILGIDPGEKPGFAVLGDGDVLYAAEATGPEEVIGLVEEALEAYPSASYTVRIGHGAQIHRDRILNALTQVPVAVEIVDEAETTSNHSRMSGERNIRAAVNIALSHGEQVPKRIRPLDPSPGEIRDIQDRSREASHGRITISRDLAEKVAAGRMSMEAAIAVQQGDRDA